MSAVKPLCGFCGGHHYAEEPHPGEAVREALAKLRETEPPVSAIEVGRKMFAEVRERVTKPPVTVHPEPEPVTESPAAVTEKAVVTESPLPKVAVLRKRGRPKKAGALSRAEIQRAYRERRVEET